MFHACSSAPVSVSTVPPRTRPAHRRISAAQARRYIEDGEFDEKGMLPKMEAGVFFVSQKKGRCAVITSAPLAVEALHGSAGTIIS